MLVNGPARLCLASMWLPYKSWVYNGPSKWPNGLQAARTRSLESLYGLVNRLPIAAYLLRSDQSDSVRKFDRSGLLGEDTVGGGGDGAREFSILGSKGWIRGWHYTFRSKKFKLGYAIPGHTAQDVWSLLFWPLHHLDLIFLPSPLHFPLVFSCKVISPMHSVFLMPSFTRLNHVSPVHISTWIPYY
jgi:hypothetical protein